jgi:hypothetical protein
MVNIPLSLTPGDLLLTIYLTQEVVTSSSFIAVTLCVTSKPAKKRKVLKIEDASASNVQFSPFINGKTRYGDCNEWRIWL